MYQKIDRNYSWKIGLRNLSEEIDYSSLFVIKLYMRIIFKV